MDSERWGRLKNAFSAVIARGPASASEALSEVCEGDTDLMRALRPLVDEHFRLVDASTVEPYEPAPDHEIEHVVAGRFQVLARLGGGQFGDVYRVFDQGTKAELALKILRSTDPVALEYFKREFRSLTGIHHRNIVAFRDLVADRDRWMFSMEFVDGVDFLRYIRDQSAGSRDTRLRSCLVQLAEGLAAVHRHNLLHRDLKPSNVLVESNDRVVLLDFGLVRAFGEDTQASVTLAGTPDYMSPEQAAGEPLREACDWYAVGVMLYEALTGVLPFRGSSVLEVLHRKQIEQPIPPRDLVPDVAVDLNELCVNLLQRDPAVRASYGAVVRLVPSLDAVQTPVSRQPPFVGRDSQLLQMAAAFAASETSPVVVHLSGPSGIGKTMLVREFLRRLAHDSSPLVFAGRCYESDSVPYQALDDLIDQIARHLRHLPRERANLMLPRHFAVLARMFPVLAQFLGRDTRPLPALDSAELRARALVALREMLGRFAEHHRVVLVVDDLQWGDRDGLAALHDLVSAGDAPPLLMLLAYRSEDVTVSAGLTDLQAMGRSSGLRTAFVDLTHLESAETEALAASLLVAPIGRSALDRLVEQSAGSPFLVHEIARWINTRGVEQAFLQQFSLDEMVQSRMAALPIESRRLLELIAVAGQPTELPTLQACGGFTRMLAARDELVAARLIRSRLVRDREELEVYHDRLRTTIALGLIESTFVERHRALARALEATGAHDPERIAVHFEHAGEPSLCATYALQAARRSAHVLAFNKAARFFRLALSTDALVPSNRRVVHRELADSLANAGLGPDAAEHYLAACMGASRDEQLELQQRSAEQLLYSGHVDRGLAMFATVLGHVGMTLPSPTSVVPVNLLIQRARLRVRGLRWRERTTASVPRELLLKCDTCASVATGLALIDIARGAALQTTSLLLALQTGEPSRISRALAMEAGYQSTAGASAETRVKALLAVARDLADRTGDARATGLTAVMTAGSAWGAGRWEECYRQARAARATLADRPERVTWERDTASIFEVEGLRWMGRWSTMKAILPELLEDARARGDLYAQAILQMHGGSCAELANDQPERARAGLSILDRWSNTGFHVEHLVETHNRVEIALYGDQGSAALQLVTARWPALQASLLLRVQNFKIQMHSLRARAALSAASLQAGTAREALLRLARKDAHVIARQSAIWGRAIAWLLDAAVASLSGQPDAALAALGRAEDAATTVGMVLHAAVARRLRAEAIGGEDGRRLRQTAEADIIQEGVIDPGRLTAVIAPGVTSAF